MAEVEIVQPRSSYEVVSDAEAYGSCRRHGKRLQRLKQTRNYGAGVSHTCLDGLRPPTRIHRPGNISLRTGKPDKMTTRMTAEMNGGYQASVATLR
jgi:hypothetical protein